MDVNFDLSTVYPGTAEMVLLGGDLLPQGTRFPSRASASMASQRSAAILDSMGQLSACAQDLRQPITTADRVRVMHPEHRVYLMVDRAGNGGYGTVVGMLKVLTV